MAEKILDVTSYLVIALCALVLEKTLLTALGWFVFAILIPVVCGILILYFLLEKISFKALAIKFLIFSLIIPNIIPLSIKLSDIVYQSNQTNIEQMEDIIKNNGVVDEQKTEENESWFSPIKNKVLNGFSELSEDMKAMFNIFIDSVAVMLLTTCIIPFLVVVIVLWLVKYLFNFNISFEKGIATLKTLSKIKKNEQNE